MAGLRRLLAALGAALLLLAACSDGRGGDDNSPTTASSVTSTTGAGEPAAAGDCEPVERLVEPRASTHVLAADAAEFEHHPPTSGPHLPDPPEPGVHEEPVPEATQVVALELGSVVLHHGPDVGAEVVDGLAALAEGRDDVVVTPAAQPIDEGAPLAFTAWEHRQLCLDADADALDAAEAFVGEFAQAATAH